MYSLNPKILLNNRHSRTRAGMTARDGGNAMGSSRSDVSERPLPIEQTPTLKKPPHEQNPYRDARPDSKGKQ